MEASFRWRAAEDRAAGGVGDFGAAAVGAFLAQESIAARRECSSARQEQRGEARVRQRKTGAAAARGKGIDLERFVCGGRHGEKTRSI